MKTKLNVVALLSIGLLFGLSANAQKKTITKSDLPLKAQHFLKTHFAGQEPSYILEDNETFSKDYEVRFANNIEVDFDGKGNWKEVDGNHNPIPTLMVPENIIAYVENHFANTSITKIDKDARGYDVALSNGLEPEFNAQGLFVRIDD